MVAMQALRSAPLLARLVLAWLLLFVGMATVAPVMAADPTQAVCSASGVVKTLGQADQDGATAASHHTLECLLCCTSSLPPSPVWHGAQPPQPLGHVLQSIPAARLAAITAAPLPARGPPAVA
jgi:hypothetical protein